VSHGHVRLDGSKLRRVRLGRGLTMDQLAARTGGVVAARQVLEYERGRRRCDPGRLMVLCVALSVPAVSLSEVDADEAGLRDLRHWAGLTAHQAAAALGVSVWALLRAEAEGRLPRRVDRGRFVAAAGELYGQSVKIVESALCRFTNGLG
jgi:transcriptional regulator with XRE-family HTH domain